jgi:hypothetical protein
MDLNMRTFVLAILTILSLAHQAAGGEYFERIVGKQRWKQLENEVFLQHTFKGSDPLNLFPALPIKGKVQPEVLRVQPTIGVELLLLYKPKLGAHHAEIGQSTYHLKIYNILRSISTLKEIEYYSASRKRMRIFFYDAYAIESPDNRKRLEDPLVESIPLNSTIHTYMMDSSLGNYVAQVHYHYHYDYFMMSIQNQTTLWRFIIPMVQPKKLNMLVLIVPWEDQLLFYGLCYVNATNLFGIADAKTASFYNRLIALFGWFRNNFEHVMQ